MENPFEILNERLERIEGLLMELRGIRAVGNNEFNGDSLSVLNSEQVAKLLSMAKSSVYKLTHRNEIPYYKRGRLLYFKKSEIEEWLLKNRIKTNEEIELEANTYLVTRKRRY